MSNFDDDIKYLKKLKDEKERKNEELKAINSEIELYEQQILERMEIEGLDKISVSGVGTASVSVKNYPQVKDMESFVKWCYENNRIDMIQKRIASTSYNQYVAEENIMPEGTEVYQKSTLSFRRT